MFNPIVQGWINSLWALLQIHVVPGPQTDQRATRSLGHAEVQAVARPLHQSGRVAGERLPGVRQSSSLTGGWGVRPDGRTAEKPDELRGSRPVLRERAGEVPARHSPDLPLREQTASRSCARRYRRKDGRGGPQAPPGQDEDRLRQGRHAAGDTRRLTTPAFTSWGYEVPGATKRSQPERRLPLVVPAGDEHPGSGKVKGEQTTCDAHPPSRQPDSR